MKDVYLRSNYNVKTISYKVLLSLLLLILSGFYKNGIKLYIHDLVGVYGLIKPLLFTVLGFLIGSLVNIIYLKIKKNKLNLKESIFSSFHPVYGVIIASVISINTNIILFTSVTFVILLLSKFITSSRFNVMAATALIITLIFNVVGNFSFLNAYENSTVLSLDTMDYLLGRGYGGINTSYVLFLIISLIFLTKEDYYKKSIALFSSIVFSLLIVIYSIYDNNVGLILENIFSNGVLFCFIYIATEPLSSSYTKVGQIIFGVLTGLLTFLLYLIEPSLAALGAILIVSLLHQIIDEIVFKKA